MAPVKKPPHTRLPHHLREWRKSRKLSQEALANRVGVDRTTLGKIERGILPYNQDFLERLADALSCEPAELLSVNPLAPDPPRLVWDRLLMAPPETQKTALAILEAYLKTGT